MADGVAEGSADEAADGAAGGIADGAVAGAAAGAADGAVAEVAAGASLTAVHKELQVNLADRAGVDDALLRVELQHASTLFSECSRAISLRRASLSSQSGDEQSSQVHSKPNTVRRNAWRSSRGSQCR